METEHKIRLEWITQFATYKDWTQAISNPDSVKEQEQIWYENVVAASSKPKVERVIETRSQARKRGQAQDHTQKNEVIKPPPKNQKGKELVWQFTDKDGNVEKLCYDFHNGNGCKRGDQCPHIHEDRCPLKGCKKNHSFFDAHKNLRNLLKPQGGKGKGKGKGKGGKKKN